MSLELTIITMFYSGFYNNIIEINNSNNVLQWFSFQVH